MDEIIEVTLFRSAKGYKAIIVWHGDAEPLVVVDNDIHKVLDRIAGMSHRFRIE